MNEERRRGSFLVEKISRLLDLGRVFDIVIIFSERLMQ